MKSVAAATGHRHDVEPSHRGEGEIVRVKRLDDQQIVAFIGAGHEREENRLAAAGRRQNVIALERDTDALLVIALQRREILRRAGRG